jgi:hypothetical protein
MSTIFEQAVQEMIERVIELSRCYSVWWTLVNRANSVKYFQVINDHKDYFEITSNSLFQGFSIIIYQIFETRQDTINLPSLIKDIAISNASSSKTLSTSIEANRLLLGKIFSIRNKVYGHRTKKQSPEDVFNSAGITLDEMRTIVMFAQNLVSTLSEIAGVESKNDLLREFKNRENYAAEDARLILEALSSYPDNVSLHRTSII